MSSGSTHRVNPCRAAALAAATLFLAAADGPDSPQPFAIACTGTARFSDNMTGERRTRVYDLPRQVYVLDEAAGRVQHAPEPRQEFEDVCFRDGYIDSVDFSPGRVSVRAEKVGRLCDFSVNRASGQGEYYTYSDLPGGRYGEIRFEMLCDRTAIPVFDPSRNRF